MRPCIADFSPHRRGVRWFCLITFGLLASCTAWNRSPGEAHETTAFPFTKPSPEHPLANLDPSHPALPAPPPTTTPPPPGPLATNQPRLATAVHRITTKGLALTLLTFDDREFSLHVADKAGGPETEWQNARAAAEAHRAAAAINAGFFTPAGDPLGLVIEDGTRFGSWNTRSSVTSGILAVRDDRPVLRRREGWDSSQPAEHLLQAGPLLLERGHPVTGLSTTPRRPRSFLAWDGNHHWMLGDATSATLAELAAALATQPCPDARFTIALNLDGGRSSDLWISPQIAGGPLSTRRFWNNPVRNYVLLIRRS